MGPPLPWPPLLPVYLVSTVSTSPQPGISPCQWPPLPEKLFSRLKGYPPGARNPLSRCNPLLSSKWLVFGSSRGSPRAAGSVIMKGFENTRSWAKDLGGMLPAQATWEDLCRHNTHACPSSTITTPKFFSSPSSHTDKHELSGIEDKLENIDSL